MAEHRNHNINPNQSVTVIHRIMERFGMGGSLRPIQCHPCYGQGTLHYPRMLRDLSNVAGVGRETAEDEIGAWRRSVLQGGQAVQSLIRQTWERGEIDGSMDPSAGTRAGSSEARGAPRMWKDMEQLCHEPPPRAPHPFDTARAKIKGYT